MEGEKEDLCPALGHSVNNVIARETASPISKFKIYLRTIRDHRESHSKQISEIFRL